MIILQLWEWVINVLILGCAMVIWSIALFMIALLLSLVKDFIMGVVNE